MKEKRNTGIAEGGAYPKKLLFLVPESPRKEKGNQERKKYKAKVFHVSQMGRGEDKNNRKVSAKAVYGVYG